MPKVPELINQQVKNTATSFRRSPIVTPEKGNVSPRALSQVTNSVVVLAEKAAKINDKETKAADDLRVLEADEQLSFLSTSLMYDKDTGALNKKGKDSFGLPEQVFEQFDGEASKLLGSLANENQKNLFQRRVISRRQDIDGTLNKHISRESRIYENNLTKSFINNERDSAMQNPYDNQRVQISLDRQRSESAKLIKRNGGSNEDLKAAVHDVESKTHTGVITRMLDSGDDITAKTYFDVYKDQIHGEYKGGITSMLKDGALRGGAQRKSAELWESSKQNIGVSLRRAGQISDPKMQDEVVRRLKQKQSNKVLANNAVENDRYRSATEFLKGAEKKSNPKDLVPPSLWNNLTLKQQSDVNKYLNNPSNDNKKWLDFLDKDARQIADLSREEFEQKYWVHFDERHRVRAEDLWSTTRGGVSGKSPKLTNALNFTNRFKNTIRQTGLIHEKKPRAKLSKEERDLFTDLEQKAAEELSMFEANELGNKRKATGPEVQKIINDVVKRSVFVEDSWYKKDKKKPVSRVLKDEREKAYVPFEKIDEGSIARIRKDILSKKRKISKDKIQRAMGAIRLKDRALYLKIIEE